MIPKFSNDEKVPRVSDREATVVESSKKSFFARLFGSSKSEEDLIEEAREINEEVEPMAEEIEEIDEEIHELEEKREGLVTKFLNFFFGNNSSKSEEEGISQEEINSALAKNTSHEALEMETREVLKITHKWISRLPPEHLTQFRNSEDFRKYKDCLHKYNLIK
jgi:flagellar biosynthesis GTPase FlhF